MNGDVPKGFKTRPEKVPFRFDVFWENCSEWLFTFLDLVEILPEDPQDDPVIERYSGRAWGHEMFSDRAQEYQHIVNSILADKDPDLGVTDFGAATLGTLPQSTGLQIEHGH